MSVKMAIMRVTPPSAGISYMISALETPHWGRACSMLFIMMAQGRTALMSSSMPSPLSGFV